MFSNQILKNRLNHYYQLLHNSTLAYYLRCKAIPAAFNHSQDVNELWDIHSRLKQKFEENKMLIPPTIFEKCEGNSFLDLKIELAQRLLKSCEFCENLCNVDRTANQHGFCGVYDESYISSTFLHMGEEPPLIPSGTIFFSGCSFECVFCQNEDISTAGKNYPIQKAGRKVTPKDLADLATTIYNRGAKNINYVGGDPTPNLHTIISSLKFQTANVCQLWNSNFYNSLLALELLSDLIDLWLPDFKYGNNECAEKYSKIKSYWDVLRRNFTYIYEHGSRNIIIRHLVMPGHLECCSKPILKWISENVPEVIVNIMRQYHPAYLVSQEHYPEINRRVTIAEMQEVFSYAEDLGLEFQSVS
ncbi:radical SAM protein [Promethearchaeum syntrophicum]|uniref:Radical SAM protein n=1 Tax=Promethearchaeum syntrophicum TaxID=2594042 RepID=A0A5B9D706_9ARCH|nr:radical SAM protein [Candidatus Prometheoarchaeum syntrophicum]QEE14620.1 Radical SAM superfamily protein [Candidatus Prometheoarchaeum syntrophicum]